MLCSGLLRGNMAHWVFVVLGRQELPWDFILRFPENSQKGAEARGWMECESHLYSSICCHVFCGLPVTSISCLHGGLASSLPASWPWATSSSSPCPAFLAIAKSEPFIDID
ncbi:hypothetical protein STEG23_003331 [Scotinomys teguina]